MSDAVERHWRLVELLVDAVGRRWQEPDQGIWEIRAAPRHHVHSKTMCWLAVDRGVTLAGTVFDHPVPEWESRGNFPQAYSHLGLIENALNLSEASVL